MIRVVEVGPRDGLQNESALIPTETKIAFIDALSVSGLTEIEATSFVNPAAVPQLADASEVMTRIARQYGVRYSVLIPNERGLDRALEAGVEAIALFTSATEAFCQKNIRCSIDESFARFKPVAEKALAAGCSIRGYVSVAFDCPFSGPVEPAAALIVAERLLELGCEEVSIADTIGTATPDTTTRLVETFTNEFPVEKTAFHFHDTTGAAISNVEVALSAGYSAFDSSAGGLGGCPFAPGAPGNLSTESLLSYLADAGFETGINLDTIRSAVAGLRSTVALSK
jgi:isopropylmalate/homocitrate/citramalate synthase